MAHHEIAFSSCKVLGAWTGYVPGSHRTVDPHLGRTGSDESAKAVFAVSCVMLIAIT